MFKQSKMELCIHILYIHRTRKYYVLTCVANQSCPEPERHNCPQQVSYIIVNNVIIQGLESKDAFWLDSLHIGCIANAVPGSVRPKCRQHVLSLCRPLVPPHQHSITPTTWKITILASKRHFEESIQYIIFHLVGDPWMVDFLFIWVQICDIFVSTHSLQERGKLIFPWLNLFWNNPHFPPLSHPCDRGVTRYTGVE